MTPDIINGLFEFVGSYFTWMNAFILYKEKQLKPVYWPATVFFTTWGLWNLYYYPALGQWFSFWAGCFLVLGNVAWVVLVFKYKIQGKI